MDVGGDVHASPLLGERCTDSEAGPVEPAGLGVGGLYSSGVRGSTTLCALAVALA